jgi:WASH complex subunit strumpellin
VPTFIPVDANDFTFMGRLLRNITDSLGRAMYLDSLSSWYDANGAQVFGLRYVHFLHEHLGTTFLQGLDRLIVYTVVSETRKFQRDYGFIIGGGTVSEELRVKGKKQNFQLMQELSQFDAAISRAFEALNPNAVPRYQRLRQQTENISQQFRPMIVKIGQLQLLRKLVVRQINFAAKVECAQYTACLETANKAILHNMVEIKETAQHVALEREAPDVAALVQQGKLDASGGGEEAALTKEQEAIKQAKDEEANKNMRDFMRDLTVCLEFVGQVKPMNKVYSLSRDLHHMPLVFALVTLNALNYVQYDTHLYSLVRSKKEVVLDGPHFIVGLLTIFKQYHSSNFLKYMMYLSNYLKNVIQASQFSPTGMKQLPPECTPILCFLEELMRFDGRGRDVVCQIIGPYIFDYFIYQTQ